MLNKKVLYLSYETCLDIAFVLKQLSCYNLNLQVVHLHIVKQVLYYLKEIITLDIKQKNNFIGYQLREKYGKLKIVKYK